MRTQQNSGQAWYHRAGQDWTVYLPDPRKPVALQIGWYRGTSPYTDFSLPEPPSYNRAVLADRALDWPSARASVHYRDQVRLGWISLYVLTPGQEAEYDAWLQGVAWRAHWVYFAPAQARPRRPRLLQTSSRLARNQEAQLYYNLYQQGYFQKLLNKYQCDDAAEFITSWLGNPEDYSDPEAGSRDQTDPDTTDDF